VASVVVGVVGGVVKEREVMDPEETARLLAQVVLLPRAARIDRTVGLTILRS